MKNQKGFIPIVIVLWIVIGSLIAGGVATTIVGKQGKKVEENK